MSNEQRGTLETKIRELGWGTRPIKPAGINGTGGAILIDPRLSNDELLPARAHPNLRSPLCLPLRRVVHPSFEISSDTKLQRTLLPSSSSTSSSSFFPSLCYSSPRFARSPGQSREFQRHKRVLLAAAVLLPRSSCDRRQTCLFLFGVMSKGRVASNEEETVDDNSVRARHFLLAPCLFLRRFLLGGNGELNRGAIIQFRTNIRAARWPSKDRTVRDVSSPFRRDAKRSFTLLPRWPL